MSDKKETQEEYLKRTTLKPDDPRVKASRERAKVAREKHWNGYLNRMIYGEATPEPIPEPVFTKAADQVAAALESRQMKTKPLPAEPTAAWKGKPLKIAKKAKNLYPKMIPRQAFREYLTTLGYQGNELEAGIKALAGSYSANRVITGNATKGKTVQKKRLRKEDPPRVSPKISNPGSLKPL